MSERIAAPNPNDGYDVFRDDCAQETADGLSETDRRLLHATLRTLGWRGWWDWLATNSEAASRYLASTPRERRTARFASDTARVLTQYGALWLAQYSGALNSHSHLLPDLEGRYERFGRAEFGWLLWLANQFCPDPWPFDEPADLRDPFHGDESCNAPCE